MSTPASQDEKRGGRIPRLALRLLKEHAHAAEFQFECDDAGEVEAFVAAFASFGCTVETPKKGKTLRVVCP